MQDAPVIENEAKRLKALRQTGLLDTSAEERYDRITRLAQQCFGVPIVLVSLVDTERQWFKSKIGVDVTQTARCISFCGHAIQGDAVLVVEDASQDPRFFDNPLVTGDLHLRFYAGRPLKTPDGATIGTLCLIDTHPRSLDPSGRQQLDDFARLVENEIRIDWLDQNKQPLSATIDRIGLPKMLQTLGSVISKRWLAACLAVICALAILIAMINSHDKSTRTQRAKLEKEALVLAANLRAKIETELNARLHLTYGLAGLVQTTQEVSESQFQQFAEVLGKDMSSVSSLQLAPGGIVTLVWPYERHNKAIGHDLFADPDRRAAAELAIEAGNIWLAGPITLIQGGRAIIGRYPIFTEVDEQSVFWGFATVLIDFDLFQKETGINDDLAGFELAIRGVDAKGKRGDVFVGDAKVFDNPLATSVVTLPAGSWHIAVVYKHPLPGVSTSALFLSGLLVFLLPALLYWVLRLPRNFEIAVRQASNALEQSEIRFRDAIEALSDGFVIFDGHDQLVTCNSKYKEMYAVSNKQLVTGKSFEEILRFGVNSGQYRLQPGESPDQFIHRRMTEHKDTHSIFEEQLSDGKWIRLVERPIHGGGTVGLRVDITQLKDNERELAIAKDKAEAANQAKSLFLATVSHEVRTPMNVILGLLSLLRDAGGLTTEQTNYLQTAHRSAEQLLYILNEILDLSKVEAGKLMLEEHDFNLRGLCENTLSLCKTQAEDKNLALETNIHELGDYWLTGDDGRLRQVLLNLLNNAIKFTMQGTVRFDVSCHQTTDDRHHVVFTVSDTGVGFDSEESHTLFQPFSQLDNSASRRHEGAGLGLSICKKLVELMGGTIEAKGDKGQGATFRVSLDFAQAQPKSSSLKTKPLQAGCEPVPEHPSRILVVEDSSSNQMVFHAMLQGTSHQVHMVNNGLEALQAVQEQDYDLVLMDIYMPQMNGVEATKAIRALPNLDRMPIVALTANAMKGDREKFIEAGMDDCLQKPVSKEQLLESIEHWLRYKHQCHAGHTV